MACLACSERLQDFIEHVRSWWWLRLQQFADAGLQLAVVHHATGAVDPRRVNQPLHTSTFTAQLPISTRRHSQPEHQTRLFRVFSTRLSCAAAGCAARTPSRRLGPARRGRPAVLAAGVVVSPSRTTGRPDRQDGGRRNELHTHTRWQRRHRYGGIYDRCARAWRVDR